MLVHSPPFPLIIKHVDVDQIRKVTTKDEELLSLQHQGHFPSESFPSSPQNHPCPAPLPIYEAQQRASDLTA